jgi:hypothetical protein
MLYTVSLALYALNTLNYSDSVRQDGQGDKEQDGKGQTPYKLQVVARYRL